MPSEWVRIRSVNGSQNHAFEELCCQLAEYETVPGGSRFVRKGAPDAGVECLWILRSGDEWGWQAKFFVSSVSDGEWAQLDESVQTALEKHPSLTKYFICVPINFPDARFENKKSALEKWKRLCYEMGRLGSRQGNECGVCPLGRICAYFTAVKR